MKKSSIKPLFFILFIGVFNLAHSFNEFAHETEDEHEFDYKNDGKKGPGKWGEIRPEWKLCKKGTMQSPIDLLSKRVEVVSNLQKLNSIYKPSNATIKNRGHDMMMKWEGGAGTIEINGTVYELKQAHWHSPSEHTINGKRFALEMHMVHETKDGQIAVVGILYKIGRPDYFLSLVEKYLEEVTDKSEEERVVGMMDPRKIQIGSSMYYRYIGSLTVPPCTQQVIWTILEEVRTVSKEQVTLLRVAVHDEADSNARPTQSINKRPVHLYKPRN